MLDDPADVPELIRKRDRGDGFAAAAGVEPRRRRVRSEARVAFGEAGGQSGDGQMRLRRIDADDLHGRKSGRVTRAHPFDQLEDFA
ncbi:MAG TPA: hypothetical protein VF698_05030, partial [Thermoanaerobaculia bacterium]